MPDDAPRPVGRPRGRKRPPASPEAAAFGARLAALRERKGWSTIELAGRASLSADYVRVLEAGIKSPSLRALRGLCAALGVGLGAFETPLRAASRP